MPFQSVFKRYELKYLLTTEQKERVLQAMEPYMKLDKYGRTTIRNLYFDTDNYLLIRRSIEKPVYKEKLRIRSYNKATCDSKVFVELKKKYKHVVYKRRELLLNDEAMRWLSGEEHTSKNNQIINAGEKTGYLYIDVPEYSESQLENSVEQLISQYIQNLENSENAIIPIQVGYASSKIQTPLYQNLDLFICTLMKKGYEFVTVNKM